MGPYRITLLLMASSLLAFSVHGHPWGFPDSLGSIVSASVDVDGWPASLYPAPDGPGRFYLEARRGSRYAVTLSNQTGERVGVVLTVDGLNVISGQRDEGRGRMYVLEPWQCATVRGWRVSLREVRQFTFVDEQASYAARSGKANEKMGWIEVAAFRERRDFAHVTPPFQTPPWPIPAEPVEGGLPGGADERDIESQEGSRRAEPSPPTASSDIPTAKGECDESQATTRLGKSRSYPGTGWGQRRHDPAVLVSFDPEPYPSERVTLRYEYRQALVALGVLPDGGSPRDRLWEREHAEGGFAQPPQW